MIFFFPQLLVDRVSLLREKGGKANFQKHSTHTAKHPEDKTINNV